MAYLACAALRGLRRDRDAPGLIIPTGNLGHGFAALYARAMGLPIGPIVAATNANRTLIEWHRSGTYEPRPAVATIANAMDVGAPSNFERLIDLPEAVRDVRRRAGRRRGDPRRGSRPTTSAAAMSGARTRRPPPKPMRG